MEFLHTNCIKQNGISNIFFYNKVENHLYTKFGIILKPKN